MRKVFYSNGKLLLTGEYAILDGALGLALPTSRGQSLSVSGIGVPELSWTGRDDQGAVWFSAGFTILPDGSLELKGHADGKKKRLLVILSEAMALNPDFLRDEPGFDVETTLDFPPDWGLGSSSTLIANIAQWAGVDAFELHRLTSTGSGYDIACAQCRKPLLYRLDQQSPVIREVSFDPPFRGALYFVHLNKKQDSGEALSLHQTLGTAARRHIEDISEISEAVVICRELEEFIALMERHERLLADRLGMIPVKKALFQDYKGTVKSLGAWGGDFILACGATDTVSYFRERGYHTVIPYDDMVL